MYSRSLLEPLEPRQLLSALPAGFSETTVAKITTTKAATMTFISDGRLLVADAKAGQIRMIKDGKLLTDAVLTLNIDHYNERGINGIAVDPNFASAPTGQKYVYVYYTKADPIHPDTAPNDAVNRLSRFTISSTNADKLDPASEKVLIDNIASTQGNHNGGTLAFGADGMLYLGVGEAGVSSNAQNLTNLGGKILRIKRDGTIPSDNPFATSSTARHEIWAYGLRNPFSGAFKPASGTFFINDVGQATWEEIDQIEKGKNYGWPSAEGNSSNAAFTNPIYEYNHNNSSAAITGGSFYEASQFPSSYKDKYFFGDFILKKIWTLDPATKTATTFASNTLSVVDIDVNPKDGTLWYLDLNGSVEKISFNNAATKTLRATADAYVRDGSSANSNFGSATDLQVKKSTAGFNRQTYLKFDLTGITTISTAKLRLFGKLTSTEATNIVVSLFGVATATWSESAITWNNKPAAATTVITSKTITDTTARWYEFDVTSYAKANAGKPVSFALKGAANSLPIVSFNSDESASNKPQLVITTASASLPASELTGPSAVVQDGALRRQLLSELS